MVGSSLAHGTMSPDFGQDKATSDWETVAADEDVGRRSYPRRMNPEENIFEVQDLIGHGYRLEGQPKRSTTAPKPADFSPATAAKHGFSAADTGEPSDIRYSNFVNESPDIWTDANSVENFASDGPQTAFGQKQANIAAPDGQGPNGLVASNSITSSSLTVDRFKFDYGQYSVFLRPGAEREVSRALREAGFSDDLSLVASQASANVDDDDQAPVADQQFYDPSAIQST
ncbi:putative ankyrin repeat domain protein [Purpureocillium lavendulum]|uniref:Ankyrin repeat domain protein n=1 Tax=Purpureocillium lavendulum TaxID=1247861 RepID=A0AB34FW41_9HYPO|nr:putative ankyrin repeat domain protein [Purpureocillium lavendulum]